MGMGLGLGLGLLGNGLGWWVLGVDRSWVLVLGLWVGSLVWAWVWEWVMGDGCWVSISIPLGAGDPTVRYRYCTIGTEPYQGTVSIPVRYGTVLIPLGAEDPTVFVILGMLHNFFFLL